MSARQIDESLDSVGSIPAPYRGRVVAVGIANLCLLLMTPVEYIRQTGICAILSTGIVWGALFPELGARRIWGYLLEGTCAASLGIVVFSLTIPSGTPRTFAILPGPFILEVLLIFTPLVGMVALGGIAAGALTRWLCHLVTQFVIRVIQDGQQSSASSTPR